MSGFEATFDFGPVYCRVISAGSAPDPNCSNLQNDLENWHAVNRAIVAYASALAAMADDSKDKNEQDDISTALGAVSKVEQSSWSTALNSNVTSGVSQGVSSLISGIVGIYRRERLAATIKDSNEALQNVVRGLDENIKILDKADLNILGTISDNISSVQSGSSPAADKSSLAISLSMVAVDITAHRLQLANYKKTADAFAKAHSELRQKLDGLGDPKADFELLGIIASDVAKIAKSVNTAFTPPSN